jgi:ABC-type cobalamin transport system permease subunit
MLTANVGFLAIPGVVLSNLSGTSLISASQVVIFTSASQIASSLSVIASIGSIMIGLLLVRHNRTKQKEDPAGAVSGQSYLCVPS